METMTKISVISRSQEVADADFNKLFDELVPATGKADSKAGEILRAMARLAYRYFNDGDIFGVGYGNETVNPAGRFLCEKMPEIADTLWKLYGEHRDERYEQGLLEVQNYVIDYILANPQLREVKNSEDYLDWRRDDDADWEKYEYDEEEEW